MGGLGAGTRDGLDGVAGGTGPEDSTVGNRTARVAGTGRRGAGITARAKRHELAHLHHWLVIFTNQ